MKWARAARVATLALVCSALLIQPVSAQQNTGTITGVVTDESGAVLPGVTVTVKQAETGFTRDFVTTSTGAYTASLLPLGKYVVTFTLQGFQARTVSNIDLHVGDRLEINSKMGIGGVSENVEVSAASQFVQPTPAVQNLIGPTQVQELPLNNRVFVQLATLVPGVTSDLPDEVGIGLTSVVSISVNGGRRNSVNWMVDGVSNVDVGSNVTLLSTPTLESIQEFKIITSSYAAEYARSGGGVINIVTKGGTSKFSGTGYEFYRDDRFNANSFFRNRSTNAEIAGAPPQLDYNNFGYTVGGPIVPWRKKAFFFWSQEWRKIERAPTGSTINVIPAAWLNDPANVNYVAPALRDPNAVKLLSIWPEPNLGTSQFIASLPAIQNTRQEVIRGDFDIRPNMRVTGRYTHDLSNTRELGGLFLGTTVPKFGTTDTKVPGQVASAELRSTHTRFMNEAKYQFSSNRISTTNPDGTRNKKTDYGVDIPELFAGNEAGRIPNIAVTGLASAGSNQLINIEYFNHTVMDTLTWQKGGHSLKFGAMAAFEAKNENAANNTHGGYAFVAGGGRTAFQNFLTGNRDGLCGVSCTYSESEIDITNHLRFQRYEAFAQDTWRVARGVTLDYGVRYALYPAVKDQNNILTNFVPALYSQAGAPTYTNAAGSLIVRGTGNPLNGIIVADQNSPFGRGIYETDRGAIQPRVGFSWDPTREGKMIVRGGYGIYFDQPLVGIFEQNAFVNPPFANTVSLQNASLSNPAAGVPPGTTGVRTLQATSVPFDTPRMQQFNVGMQRQLYSRGVIDVGYVGSRGDNLIQPVDINQPQPQDVIAQGGINVARPYDGYGTITMRQTTAYSRYHGLLTSFRHEHGRNGSLTLNYTLSRNRTTSTNDRDAIDLPQNPLDLDIEYADARTDRRHVFNANFVYELPFYRNSTNALAKAALGGWQMAGIVNVVSGAPIPRITANIDSGRRGGRADQIGDPNAGNLDFPFWFNPAAFAPPSLGAYGNSVRAPFRLPGRHQWDLTASKNWYVRTLRFQFRADLINAFNHTQWLGVDAACSAAATLTQNRCDIGGADTFGQITSTRAAREIQLGFKLFW
ncbi:MAG: carboxypeptidase-like regulatory domain-containing protein [Acidobacteriota bacterium]|nr:carboxypeptidase-like regulatory domain-containing protein [Acidobacteriota bacterium]